MNATFRCPGPVAQGERLVGLYKWSQGVALAVSVAVAVPGTAATVFALTVDGVESGYEIALGAGESRVVDVAPDLDLSAEAELGVTVKIAGAVEENPVDVTVTLDIVPLGGSGTDGTEETDAEWTRTVPLVFRTAGPLYAGVTMQGRYTFSHPATLRFARCRCHAGDAACTITVYMGGVSSTGSLTIEAESDEAQDDTFVLQVPADTAISARVTTSGALEDCPTDAALVILAADADAFPTMRVRYVGEDETVALYEYDPLTRELEEIEAGVTAGRGSIVEAAGALTVELEGDTVAVIDTAALHVNTLTETELVAPKTLYPRLDFVVGSRVVASLAADGLRTPTFREPAAFGWTGIELAVGGVPVAVIAEGGVGAPECLEDLS